MIAARSTTKKDLATAAVDLAAQGGTGAATIRAIAHRVGITEGAVYRHYRSKQELWLEAYVGIVREMIAVKQAIVAAEAPAQTAIREWVRTSYDFFDRHPNAFTFVLLIDHDLPPAEQEITRKQSELLRVVLERAQAEGQLRPLDLDVAVGHFVSVMLNIPRLINQRGLEGPASQYVDEVSDAIWRMLRSDA